MPMLGSYTVPALSRGIFVLLFGLRFTKLISSLKPLLDLRLTLFIEQLHPETLTIWLIGL